MNAVDGFLISYLVQEISTPINAERSVDGIKNWLTMLEILAKLWRKKIKFVTLQGLLVDTQIVKSTIIN